MPPKAKRAPRRSATARKREQKPRKTARKASTDSAAAAPAAGGQPPGKDREVAAPVTSFALFALQGGWPDPLTHRRRLLQCLGLSARCVDELLRRVLPKDPQDRFALERLQAQDPTHNYPLRVLLAVLKEAEDAALPWWQRRQP